MSEAARGAPRELRLELPAAHSAERMARSVLNQFARREKLPKEEIDLLEFVASEMLSNAVDHGGGRGTLHEADLKEDVRTTLLFSIQGGAWKLSISDQGGGDPARMSAMLADDDALPDLEDERGRGFFLLRGMLDRLEVKKSADGRGLEFIAVKSFGKP